MNERLTESRIGTDEAQTEASTASPPLTNNSTLHLITLPLASPPLLDVHIVIRIRVGVGDQTLVPLALLLLGSFFGEDRSTVGAVAVQVEREVEKRE